MYGRSQHGEPLVFGCLPHSAATDGFGAGTRKRVAHVNIKKLAGARNLTFSGPEATNRGEGGLVHGTVGLS
jgi:hypothetical protein